MKKSKSALILVIIVALLALWGVKAYNNMVSQEEGVSTAWANVESQYQRRADLIPNLVNTVKGYAAHESETLQAVVNARTKATSINIDAENMTPEQLQEFQKAQSEVGGALGRLIAVAESYPDLKANQNFLDLQHQLEGTENRINVARERYNDAVRVFNTAIRTLPGKLINDIFLHLEAKEHFKAEEGAREVPKVSF